MSKLKHEASQKNCISFYTRTIAVEIAQYISRYVTHRVNKAHTYSYAFEKCVFLSFICGDRIYTEPMFP